MIASTLLGVEPPRLSARMLVRSGELFGISEGATRVAMSRMVAAGELVADDEGYRLAGRLLDRQARQSASRTAARRRWDGQWAMAMVPDGRRSAADRAELREAMAALRLAEAREGVWVRPDNLDPDRLPAARAVVEAQCQPFHTRPDGDPVALAAQLWDLTGWADRARELQAGLAELMGQIEAGDTEVLAPGFVRAASVLRHFQADPLLPEELLPADWPGDALRAEYERYDAAFTAVWRRWHRAQRAR